MKLLDQWAFVGIFFAIAWVFPALPILGARLLAPHKPNALKASTYECGVETVGDTWVQFKVQYYLYGLIFLIFDIDMVFLFPWAVAYKQLGWFAFGAGFLFISLMCESLLYAVKKDALRWF